MEKLSNKETREKLISKIKLHFFRHSIKGPKAEDDRFTQLSQKGRELAAERKIDVENKNLSTIVGTDRIRTQETAGIRKTGNSDLTVEEIMNETGLLGSPKAAIDNRLNFQLDPNSETGKRMYEAFMKGKLVKYLVENSDDDVLEHGDFDKNTSYSKFAANIAEIILGALRKGSDKWHRIYEAEQEREKQRKFPKGYTQSFEKLFGTHEGVLESFLAKVIEKTKGVEERTKFVEALENKGFDETEGFDMEIINDGDSKVMYITYDKFDEKGNKIFSLDENISEELLDKIVKEGSFFIDKNKKDI